MHSRSRLLGTLAKVPLRSVLQPAVLPPPVPSAASCIRTSFPSNVTFFRGLHALRPPSLPQIPGSVSLRTRTSAAVSGGSNAALGSPSLETPPAWIRVQSLLCRGLKDGPAQSLAASLRRKTLGDAGRAHTVTLAGESSAGLLAIVRSQWGNGSRWNPQGSTWGGGGRSWLQRTGGTWDSGDSVLGLLIASNLAVFLAWQTLDPRLMARHFMVSSDALARGRWYTTVTSAFSQRELNHLLANMVSLYFFGREVGLLFGGRYLLGLYLTGGVAGSLAHVAYFRLKNQPVRDNRYGYGYSHTPYYAPSPPALGASAAVNAVVIFTCLLEPFRVVYLNLILPVPSIALGALYVLHDLYGAQSGTSRVGHAAHLGGAAVGVLAWLQYWMRRRRGGLRF